MLAWIIQQSQRFCYVAVPKRLKFIKKIGGICHTVKDRTVTRRSWSRNKNADSAVMYSKSFDFYHFPWPSRPPSVTISLGTVHPASISPLVTWSVPKLILIVKI